MRTQRVDAAAPPLLNFQHLCRDHKKVDTRVVIYNDYQRSEWMRLGAIMFRERDNNHRGIWSFGAYLWNATDFEHDAAWLLKIELVGVRFTSCEHGQTSFEGFIKADDLAAFRVPPTDYDPLTLKGVKQCGGTREEYCRREEKHLIVPEGWYLPPPNEELFNLVRGRRIEVTTGLSITDEEET